MPKLIESWKQALLERGRLPGMDGLRGLAALAVLFCHNFKHTHLGSFSFYERMKNYAGGGGVELFFVLSGFLISYPFLKALLEEKALPPLRPYFRSRMLRILPLYFISTVGVALLMWAQHAPGTDGILTAIPYYLTLTINLFSEHNFINSVTWSVATEFQFYVTLPLLMLALSSAGKKRLPWLLSAVVGVALAYQAAIWFLLPEIKTDALLYRSWAYTNILARYAQFGTGMLVAYCYLSFPALKPRAYVLGIVLGLLALAILCTRVVYLPFSMEAWQYFGATLLGTLAFALLAAYCLYHPASRASRLIDNPVLTFFGKISYSVYLLHRPIHDQFVKVMVPQGVTNIWGLCAASTLLVTVISVASYLFIERPFLLLKKPR